MSDPKTETPIYGSPESVSPRQVPSGGPQDLPRTVPAPRRRRRSRSQVVAIGLGGGVLALGVLGLAGTLGRASLEPPATQPVTRAQAAPAQAAPVYRAPDVRALTDQAGGRPAADDRAENDEPAQKDAGPAVPDVEGKSLFDARKILGWNAPVRTRDGTGQGRDVLWPANWRVCHQNPRPGTSFGDEPVDLVVVKFGESC